MIVNITNVIACIVKGWQVWLAGMSLCDIFSTWMYPNIIVFRYALNLT